MRRSPGRLAHLGTLASPLASPGTLVGLAVVAAAFVTGCKDHHQAPERQAPPPVPASTREALPPPPPPHRVELVAASPERGLAEYFFSGQIRTSLSETPATAPRLDPEGETVFFVGVGDRTLRRLSLDDLTETAIATLPALPPSACAPAGSAPVVTEISPVDGVRLHDETLCVELVDSCDAGRFGTRVLVDVGTGQLHTQDLTEPSPCPAPPPPEPGETRGYEVQGGQLYQVRGELATPLMQIGDPGGNRELISPTGRWQVFSDIIGSGQEGHRSLFLLDTARGDVYSLAAGRWRPAIAPGNLGHLDDVETLSAVAASTVRWLPGHDLLLVDTMVVFPGEQIVDLGYVTAL